MHPIAITCSAILFSTSIALAGQPQAAQSRELHLRFEAISPVPQTMDETLRHWPRPITEQGQLSKAEPPPRPPRSQELGPDQLRIEALDAHGNLRYFQHLADPRILRAEFPAEGQTTGPIESSTIITDVADFLMSTEPLSCAYQAPAWLTTLKGLRGALHQMQVRNVCVFNACCQGHAAQPRPDAGWRGHVQSEVSPMTEQQQRCEAMHEGPHGHILRLMINVRGRDAWERRGGDVHPTGRPCGRAAVWTGEA